jgi:fatty acid desaturase
LPTDVLEDRDHTGDLCRVIFLLVFVAATWWQALPLAIMLGLSMAAIGFNIEHDGGHQAYSNHAWVNRLMAMTMDLIGASSYVWHRKHVVVHHTYTNLTGHDADIELWISWPADATSEAIQVSSMATFLPVAAIRSEHHQRGTCTTTFATLSSDESAHSECRGQSGGSW